MMKVNQQRRYGNSSSEGMKTVSHCAIDIKTINKQSMDWGR